MSLQVCVLENCFPLAFDCNACSINILIGLISICIAFFVKMTLRKMIMSHIEIDYKDQIYYNPQVLKYFFQIFVKLMQMLVQITPNTFRGKW